MRKTFQDWLAGAREHRLALIAASTCSLLVAVLLLVAPWIHVRTPQAGRGAEAEGISFPVPPRPHAGKRPPARGHAAAPARKQAGRSAQAALPAGYYVQAGAFHSPQRAGLRLRQLKSAGWPARRVQKGEGLHAVLVGPYATRRRAEGARRRLSATMRIHPFILHIEAGR